MKIKVLEEKSTGYSDQASQILESDLTMHEVPGGIGGMTKVLIISPLGSREVERLGLKVHDSLPPIQFKYTVIPFNLQEAKIYLEQQLQVEYL